MEKKMGFLLDLRYMRWVVMAAGLLIILIYNWRVYGNLYLATPDGNLYLSIADNFWGTGHFIQSARPYEAGMVVPFGLPLILTFLRIFFRDMWGILIVQYLIFIMTGHMIGMTASALVLSCIKDTDGYRFAVKLGGGISYTLSAFLYWFSSDILRDANPAAILTEVWTAFFIALFLYMSFYSGGVGKKLVIAFAICVIRPAFYPFIIYELIEIIIVRRRLSDKEKKEIKYIGIAAGLLLAFNVAVNFREAGEFVIFENYAGIAVYQANNPFTQTDEYHSGRAKEFVPESDEKFWNTYNDLSLTTGERNKIYTDMAKDYIRSHLRQTIRNAYVRVKDLFWDRFGAYAKVVLIALCFALFRNRRLAGISLIFILIAFTTGFGLNISRYSLYILPFYLIVIAWFSGLLGGQLLSMFYNGQEVRHE